jgi:hypothetical protein
MLSTQSVALLIVVAGSGRVIDRRLKAKTYKHMTVMMVVIRVMPSIVTMPSIITVPIMVMILSLRHGRKSSDPQHRQGYKHFFSYLHLLSHI